MTISHQAHVAVEEASAEADAIMEPDPAPDRTMETKTPGFSRMRTDWTPHDAPIVAGLKQIADGIIIKTFTDAYEIMEQVFDYVREPETNEDGVIIYDRFGYKVWARRETGAYIEDFTVLTDAERSDLLFRITARSLDWKQRAADLWGDAMFAKALWEEAMAIGFDEPTGKTTDEGRTQKGRLYSREERYHAIFRSLISRKADSVVSSMELLALRLSQSVKLTT